MGKTLGIIGSILGIIVIAYAAGMAWQAVVDTQKQTRTDIETIKHVLVSEHPAYTTELFP